MHSPKFKYSLAYKFVAIFVMLCEVNHCARKLHLPIAIPVTMQDLTYKFAGHPRLVGEVGALDTKQFSFGFGRNGRLEMITRLHPFEDLPLLEITRRLWI